ncbi:MAG TPA: PQQ-binding-like beta-propeller repeat protein [Pirellulales bacterium]|nr:PQQ-binding-like beta-propeller repeat protein [Pirellulales bacterium]
MIRSWRLVSLILLAALIVSPRGAARAADWPTFRGADRTAVSKETGLLEAWPEEGPPLVWQVEGTGRGYTSLAIVGDRIYLVGDGVADVEDQDEYLLCHDRKTGARLWATKTGPAWNSGNPAWQSSRSTPTVDQDRVYALTATGDLICCDAASGAERWRENLKTDFGGKKADGWGYSESVLVDGDKLICTPGGEQTTMAALDKLTGETIWTTVREGDRGAGHVSAVIAEVGGVRVYVQTTGGGALGVRASDGKLLWSYPIDKTTAVAPTPIISGDLVFFSAGYKRGGALLKQIADGDGVTIEEVYPLKPELSNKHGGIVLVDGRLYGDTDSSGIPFCADLMTGEIAWKGRGSGRGSVAVAAAEGRLYLHFDNGTMVLAKADPAGYEEVGSFKVPHSGERPSWSHPVILDGKLYLREQNALLCYDIRANPAAAAGE